MEKLREELHGLIDKHGIDYEKVIVTDKRLHKRIISAMTKDPKKEEDKVLKGALWVPFLNKLIKVSKRNSDFN